MWPPNTRNNCVKIFSYCQAIVQAISSRKIVSKKNWSESWSSRISVPQKFATIRYSQPYTLAQTHTSRFTTVTASAGVCTYQRGLLGDCWWKKFMLLLQRKSSNITFETLKVFITKNNNTLLCHLYAMLVCINTLNPITMHVYPYVTKSHFSTAESLKNGSLSWDQEHRSMKYRYPAAPWRALLLLKVSVT